MSEFNSEFEIGGGQEPRENVARLNYGIFEGTGIQLNKDREMVITNQGMVLFQVRFMKTYKGLVQYWPDGQPKRLNYVCMMPYGTKDIPATQQSTDKFLKKVISIVRSWANANGIYYKEPNKGLSGLRKNMGYNEDGTFNGVTDPFKVSDYINCWMNWLKTGDPNEAGEQEEVAILCHLNWKNELVPFLDSCKVYDKKKDWTGATSTCWPIVPLSAIPPGVNKADVIGYKVVNQPATQPGEVDKDVVVITSGNYVYTAELSKENKFGFKVTEYSKIDVTLTESTEEAEAVEAGLGTAVVSDLPF